jgi:hypothetical protein
MPSVTKIIEDLHSRSDKIGEITRTISLSVLALVWLFIAGGGNKPALPSPPNTELLLVAGFLVLLSLLSDYLQLVAGYANSKEVLEIAEATESKEAKYNPKSFLYRARTALFWLKQAFALSALVALLLGVLSAYACG